MISYFGGVALKTLFVYCSADDILNALCKESVRNKADTYAIELDGDFDKSPFSRYFGINRAKRSCGEYRNIDVEQFDKIILACDEYMGEVPPEMCAFINDNNLRYKVIDCLVLGDGRGCRKAIDALRVRVSLSGGTVRNAIGISAKELKKESEDILFSVRHRMAV